MSWLVRFFSFWYDFLVGDDWLTAFAVMVALVLTGVLAHAHVTDWWLLPLVVIAALGVSLWRLTRHAKPG